MVVSGLGLQRALYIMHNQELCNRDKCTWVICTFLRSSILLPHPRQIMKTACGCPASRGLPLTKSPVAVLPRCKAFAMLDLIYLEPCLRNSWQECVVVNQKENHAVIFYVRMFAASAIVDVMNHQIG